MVPPSEVQVARSGTADGQMADITWQVIPGMLLPSALSQVAAPSLLSLQSSEFFTSWQLIPLLVSDALNFPCPSGYTVSVPWPARFLRSLDRPWHLFGQGMS